MGRLDAGCGAHMTGDVNLDLTPDNLYRSARVFGSAGFDVSARGSGRLFVVGHVERLPFKPNSFGEVFCSHVFEQLPEGNRFLEEARRVAARRIVIRIPAMPRTDRVTRRSDCYFSYHCHSWSRTAFETYLWHYFSPRRVDVQYTKLSPVFGGRRGAILEWLALVLRVRNEIEATVTFLVPGREWCRLSWDDVDVCA